jgi:hypothetical protein
MLVGEQGEWRAAPRCYRCGCRDCSGMVEVLEVGDVRIQVAIGFHTDQVQNLKKPIRTFGARQKNTKDIKTSRHNVIKTLS